MGQWPLQYETNSNIQVPATLTPFVSETVRIPDPVYSKVTREAQRQDVSRGAIIKEWQEKADKFDELEARRR